MTTPLGNYSNFSWAIMSLFAWLVPQISMEIGEYHRALLKSPLWSTDEDRAIGRRAVRNASIIANVVGLAFFIGGAAAVALTTLNLDARMVSIILGLSHLVGATFLFFLSWYFPEWLEVYHVKTRRSVLPVTRSVKALRFNVIWSVLAQHLRVYFFFLPFCCGARRGLVAIASVVGIAIGLLIDVCVYLGKERLKTGRKKMWLIFAMISIAVIVSGVLFGVGVDYINYVWGSKEKDNVALVVSCAFVAWLVAGAIIHVLLWRCTKDNVKEMLEGTDAKSARQLNQSTKYKNPVGEAIVSGAPKAIDGTVDLAKAAVSKVKDSTGVSKSTPIEIDSERQSQEGEDEEEPASKVVGFAEADGADEEVGEKMEEAQDKEAQDPAECAQGGAEGEGDEEDAMFAEEGLAAQSDGEVEEDPTLCELCKMKCCCARCGGGAQCCANQETPQSKAFCCAKWTAWTILSVFSVFLVIVNSGATSQQDYTRERLPLVQEKLYKVPDWLMKEVCAYDGDGTEGSLNENSTITTFTNKEAANEAGYLVLHCGKCGHCSTYPNVKYQYTTRNYLAEASRKCAMNSFLGGGGKDYTRDCHMSPPINFDYECGTCWMETAHCAMEFCSFIGIQSFFINTFTNLAVTPDDVTGATCNEANCEAWEYPNNFANCSGASRRKQNIQNTIRRPEYQMCTIVDVDWAKLFPGQ